jgi:hypothetical protein
LFEEGSLKRKYNKEGKRGRGLATKEKEKLKGLIKSKGLGSDSKYCSERIRSKENITLGVNKKIINKGEKKKEGKKKDLFERDRKAVEVFEVELAAIRCEGVFANDDVHA